MALPTAKRKNGKKRDQLAYIHAMLHGPAVHKYVPSWPGLFTSIIRGNSGAPENV